MMNTVATINTINTKEDVTMTNATILIHKEAGTKKDAVRVNTAADIPEFLLDSIAIIGDKLELTCVEGNEMAPAGSVIGYEKSEQTKTGWNTWCIGNAATNLIEKDGVFYKKATVFKAQVLSDSLPDFLEGADVKQSGNRWTIKTDWGESTGKIGQAYWVLYGTKENGKPDANILTKTEKSFRDYIVCDEDGNDLGWLYELDKK